MGIFYRGDRRDPQGEGGVFDTGFTLKEEYLSPEFRRQMQGTHGLDVVPGTTVHLTTDLGVAAVFATAATPFEGEKTGWVYILELDGEGMTNINFIQWSSAMNRYRMGMFETNKQLEDAMFFLYQREHGIQRVDSEKIVGALKVKTSAGANFGTGGTFTCLEWLQNPQYGGKNSNIFDVILKDFVADNPVIKLSLSKDGFHRSEPHSNTFR